MKEKDLAIAAIKEEARKKPEAKFITFTGIEFTFKELSEKIDEKDKTVFDLVVKPYTKQLKKDKEFKRTIMRMLGLE